MGAYEFLHLEVVKTASKASAQIGETITYSYSITNTSNVTVKNLVATDNKLGAVTLGTTTLAAGAGTSGMLTYTIKATDANPLINRVSVSGTTPTAVVKGGASASVAVPGLPGNPAISAKVTADKTTAAIGETITYTYTVTNTGDKVLDNIMANASFGPVNLGKTTLIPAESAIVDVKHTVTSADLPSPLVNTLTVKGSPPVGDDVNAQDQVVVALADQPGNPSISAKVTADKTSAAVGETITYTYLVTNTGDVVLDNILANDSFGPVNLVKTTLAPAESTSVEDQHTVTSADLPSPLVNTLTVKGSPPVGDDVNAQDQVVVVVGLHKFIYLPIVLIN
jgi:uncharacterized repeat protein (TIGR01451 family)